MKKIILFRNGFPNNRLLIGLLKIFVVIPIALWWHVSNYVEVWAYRIKEWKVRRFR